MQVVNGQDQRGRVGTPLPQQLRVRVLDTNGAPLIGARVRWTPPDTTHGRAEPAESQTGSDGTASTTWILGSLADQRLNAHLGGPPTQTFNAQADGFTLTCSPASASFAPGQVRATSCAVASVGEFTGSVTLAALSVPEGIEVAIGSSTLSLPAAAAQAGTTLQIGVGSGVAAGTYHLELQATSGEDRVVFRLTVEVIG